MGLLRAAMIGHVAGSSARRQMEDMQKQAELNKHKPKLKHRLNKLKPRVRLHKYKHRLQLKRILCKR
jgi:hypothetical protein